MGPTIIIHQCMTGEIHVMCSLCSDTEVFAPGNMEGVTFFQDAHKHEGLVTPNTALKTAATSMEKMVKTLPLKVQDEDDYGDPPATDSWTDTLGTFQVHVGGRAPITGISPNAFKLVAKLSNFNVDFQFTRTKYRALCGQCQTQYPLTRDDV